jgi:hypothetical protein
MRKIASLVAAAFLLSIASAGLLLAQQAPPAAGAPPAGRGAGAPGRGGAPPPPFRIMSPEKRDRKLENRVIPAFQEGDFSGLGHFGT